MSIIRVRYKRGNNDVRDIENYVFSILKKK